MGAWRSQHICGASLSLSLSLSIPWCHWKALPDADYPMPLFCSQRQCVGMFSNGPCTTSPPGPNTHTPCVSRAQRAALVRPAWKPPTGLMPSACTGNIRLRGNKRQLPFQVPDANAKERDWH